MQSSPLETVGQVNLQQDQCRAHIEPHLDMAFRLLALLQPPADQVLTTIHDGIAQGEAAVVQACASSSASLDSAECRQGMDVYFQSVAPILQSIMAQACAAAPQSQEQARKTLLDITSK